VGVLDASNSSSASSFNRMGSRTSYVRSAANSRAAYINSGVAQNDDCQPRLFGLTQCPQSQPCRSSSAIDRKTVAWVCGGELVTVSQSNRRPCAGRMTGPDRFTAPKHRCGPPTCRERQQG
jgi:hypothetical protein